ncbi:MAG: serine hydrolase [Bacteroidales bacterium]|nr:serine hydrolase [Bacteroidales bacterium]
MKSIILLTTSFFLIFSVNAQYLSKVAPEEVGMDSKRLQQTDLIINQAIADKEIPGAVLAVVRNGKMAYLKSYGNKQLYPSTVAMDVNTVFDLASLTKPMATAISAIILVERGKLRLIDKVNLFIPEFKAWQEEKETKDIRVIDLMTHTSGLPSYAPISKIEKAKGSNNPDKMVNYIAIVDREFEPQTDFQYSCLNYIALQRIIETITKQDLRTFAKQNIYDVLGMVHTDFIPTGETLALTAPTERLKNGKMLIGIVHDPLAREMNLGISGNAGLFSDANDLAILVAALQNNGEYNGKRILSPMGVKIMRSVPRNTKAIGRTPGWDTFTPYSSNNGDLFGPNTYGHTGYTGTSITIDPDANTAVILLTNRAHPNNGGDIIRLRSLVSNVVAASIKKPETLDAIEETPPKEASIPRYHDHYYKRIVDFKTGEPVNSESIVMLGNSITEGGGNWAQKMGIKNLVNRGISGDNVSGVFDRLNEITKGKPKKIFLKIGINDISHHQTSDFIVSRIAEIVEKIKSDSPRTQLYIQSLLPINESIGIYSRLNGRSDQIADINIKLKALAKNWNLTYIDLYPLFVEPGTQTLRADLTGDGLHISEEGYKIWRQALTKHL